MFENQTSLIIGQMQFEINEGYIIDFLLYKVQQESETWVIQVTFHLFYRKLKVMRNTTVNVQICMELRFFFKFKSLFFMFFITTELSNTM